MTLYFEYLLLVNICGGLLVCFAVSKCLRTGLNIRMVCIILFLYTLSECLVLSLNPQLSGFLAAVSILVISKFTVKRQMILHAAIILLLIFSSGSLSLYTANLLNFQSFLFIIFILFVLLSVMYLITAKGSEWVSFSSVQASFICEVKLKDGQSMWSGNGYLDSGNALSAPFSGKPVMFADANVASELLPAEVVAYLNGYGECPDQWKQKISYIPSKTVHKECEILLGIECEKVEVESNGSIFVFEKIPVVFSREQYYVEQSCHCLLSPLQMLHCYQK